MKRRLLRQPAWPWSRIEDVEGDPSPLDDFRFFGVLNTWNEEDVVEACVRNALSQGCESVFLVDNASDDHTVERAVQAGATLARRYATDRFDDQIKYTLMNEIVESVSRHSGSAHVWWLWLDADEFSHGRSGMTLRRQLETLDRRFRIVGGQFLNHYPSGAPQSVPGRHPLDYQSLAEAFFAPNCRHGHWKHPLQRWDARGPRITTEIGFHTVSCVVTLAEPLEFVIMHHFPFRDEATTRGRMAKLWGANGPAARPRAVATDPSAGYMRMRFESSCAVYRRDWAEVTRMLGFAVTPNEGQLKAIKGVNPRPWTELVEGADTFVERWYQLAL